MLTRNMYFVRNEQTNGYLKAFLVWTAIGLFLAGCHKTEATAAKSVAVSKRQNIVVLLDKTASVKDQLGVFRSAVNKIVSSLKPGDSFKLAEITGSSAADFDFVLRTRIPEDPTYSVLETNESEYKDAVAQLNSKREALKKTILEQVNAELTKKPSAMQTDLFGAIYTASLFLSQQKGQKTLVILSDMIEENNHWRFNRVHWTQALKNRILAREDKLHLIPDMHGINVYVVGARGQTLEVMQNIRDFWVSYFNKAGATLSPDHYAHTLLNWSE